MKKLVLAASIFVGLSVSAQSVQFEKREKPTIEQKMKAFDDLKLSKSQKTQIEGLLKEREAKFEKKKPQFKEGKFTEKRKGEKSKLDSQKIDRKDLKSKKEFKGEKSAQFKIERQEFDAQLKQILSSSQYKKLEAKKEKAMKDRASKRAEFQKHKKEFKVKDSAVRSVK